MKDRIEEAIDKLVEAADEPRNDESAILASAIRVALQKTDWGRRAMAVAHADEVYVDVDDRRYYILPSSFGTPHAYEIANPDFKRLTYAKVPVDPEQIAKVVDAISDDIEKDQPESDREDDEESSYESGDNIDVDKGDQVDAGAYGKLWVTGVGVIGDLWTSEDKDDIESGRGRGLRYGFVDAIRKDGRGPWIKVKYNKDEEGYEVQ